MRRPLVLPLFALAACAAVATGVRLAHRSVVPSAHAQDAELELELVDAFPGVAFARPVFVTHAPGLPQRQFVVEQRGRIFVLPLGDDDPERATFVNLTSVVAQSGNERGLLGLAFHPDYATNGRFFVHYSRRSDGATVVAEYAADASRESASSTPVREILSLAQPYDNHNGGMLAFGPDGMLYLALGDGGSAGDPIEAGQDLGTWLGSILRVDVDGGSPYAVPADNPFVGRAGAKPEIWAYGLRNPWRFSFDRATGELWAGDVGQARFEEIDLVVRGGNYGWDRLEGNSGFEPESVPPVDPFVAPVHVYGRTEGRSVTGGYVYRGTAIPGLRGAYLFADYVSRRVWGLWRDGEDVNVTRLFDGHEVASFGEDAAGEVYLCSFTDGRVYRIAAVAEPPVEPPGEPPVEPPPVPDDLPALLSETPLFADLPGHVPAEGAVPYAVRSPLWSDGAEKERFVLLPPGKSMTYRAEDAFDVPDGTWIAKTFHLADSGGDPKRLETRVILRREGEFAMATYRWRADLSDADRVDDTVVDSVAGPDGPRVWTFPGRGDCFTCHTSSSGGLLGLTSRQVAKTNRKRGRVLRRWKKDGVLTGDLPPRRKRQRNVALEGRRKLEKRIRSYLDANCASCHRPGAPEPAGLDLRASTPTRDTGLDDVAPLRGDLGLTDARIVAPGAPDRSVLLERLRRRDDEAQMPPLGSHVVHDLAIERLRRWIERR